MAGKVFSHLSINHARRLPDALGAVDRMWSKCERLPALDVKEDETWNRSDSERSARNQISLFLVSDLFASPEACRAAEAPSEKHRKGGMMDRYCGRWRRIRCCIRGARGSWYHHGDSCINSIRLLDLPACEEKRMTECSHALKYRLRKYFGFSFCQTKNAHNCGNGGRPAEDRSFWYNLHGHNAISMGTHLLDVSGKSIAEGAVEVRLGRRTQLGMCLRSQENEVVIANLCRRPQIGRREII